MGLWSDLKGELKDEWSKRPSFKEVKAEYDAKAEQGKRKRRAWVSNSPLRYVIALGCIMNVLLALAIVPTLFLIPLSAAMIGVSVWAWRRYVTRQPHQRREDE